VDAAGGVILEGFQLKYIFFVDKKARKDLTVPILSYAAIDEAGAGMYKGKKITIAERR